MDNKRIMQRASEVFQAHFGREAGFGRAIFLNWYCQLGDCDFCYMSLEKNKKKEAKRKHSSLFAEAIVSKELGWDIEFVSGGYLEFGTEELCYVLKGINIISGKKQWLNIGAAQKTMLAALAPYLEGYVGTVETVDWDLRKKVCPSKSMVPIYSAFQHSEVLGLKKAITIIIGLGEAIEHFKNLELLVKEQNISRITFYALNPHPGTRYSSSPDLDYYTSWIAMTRLAFPNITIVGGAWIDKPEYYSAMLRSGANDITKLPALRKFGTKELHEIEKQIKSTGRLLKGTLTIMPNVNWEEKVSNLPESMFNKQLKDEILEKVKQYLRGMEKSSMLSSEDMLVTIH